MEPPIEVSEPGEDTAGPDEQAQGEMDDAIVTIDAPEQAGQTADVAAGDATAMDDGAPPPTAGGEATAAEAEGDAPAVVPAAELQGPDDAIPDEHQEQVETGAGGSSANGLTGDAAAAGGEPETKAAATLVPPSGALPPVAAAMPTADSASALLPVRPAAPEPSPYFLPGLRAIDVEIDQGPGVPCRLVRVEIDVSEAAPPPFLGGYRHRGSGTTLLHAAAQAPAGPQVPRRPPPPPRACRETQTVATASRGAQTLREAATQMARPGLLLDESGDRLVTPRTYVTAREVLAARAAAALTVQRFARGWVARRRAAGLRARKGEREAFLRDRAAQQAAEADEARRREIERRMHPVCPSDFRVLEAELDSWRRRETARIKEAGLHAVKEQAALRALLARETRLLQAIDRLRVNARHEAQDAAAHAALSSMAAPKPWALRGGGAALVHTPGTERAAALRQLYRGLVLPGLSAEERLDLLLHVKWAVGEFDCSLTREIRQLLDREADLLNRGRDPATMEGLRRRIAGLFLDLCRLPEFNPEAANKAGGNGGSRGATAEEVFAYAEPERGTARAAPVQLLDTEIWA